MLGEYRYIRMYFVTFDYTFKNLDNVLNQYVFVLEINGLFDDIENRDSFFFSIGVRSSNVIALLFTQFTQSNFARGTKSMLSAYASIARTYY